MLASEIKRAYEDSFKKTRIRTHEIKETEIEPILSCFRLPLVKIIVGYAQKTPFDYLKELENRVKIYRKENADAQTQRICTRPDGSKLNSQAYMSKFLSRLYCQLFDIDDTVRIEPRRSISVVQCDQCSALVYPTKRKDYTLCVACWERMEDRYADWGNFGLGGHHCVGYKTRPELDYPVSKRLAIFKELGYGKRYKVAVLNTAKRLFRGEAP